MCGWLVSCVWSDAWDLWFIKERRCFCVFFLFLISLFCNCSKIFGRSDYKKMNWSGEGETREASLCLEYRNSTWTPWELKTKEVFTLLLYAIFKCYYKLFYYNSSHIQIDMTIHNWWNNWKCVIDKSDFFSH